MPVVGGLLLLLGIQVYPSIGLKTPTFDEPPHIGAGLSYLVTGDFKVNLQHPPLLKEIAALPLVLRGVRWPVDEETWATVEAGARTGFQWRLGNAVIFENDPDQVMFWARLPFLGLVLLFGGAIYAWGRRLLGTNAALGALALFALDPTIVGHAPLVATDIGFAAFAFLFLFALWHYMNQRSLWRLLLCGVALGAALGSKFTGVVLLPIAALLLGGGVRWIPAVAPRRPSRLADPYASDEVVRRALWCLAALVAMVAVAAMVLEAIYQFNGSAALYLEGIRRINADHDPHYQVFMGGAFSRHFWSYYIVAYLLKEPVATMVLTAFGLTLLLRRGGAPAMDRAFLLLPPAVLFLLYSATSHNLGFRYMIPALPYLHLAGGAGLAALARAGRGWGRVPAALLCGWLAVTAAGIHPDQLSYFNEGACLLKDPGRIGLDGGTACGTLWLDDSNVDWGQGLKQLRTWLDRHAPGQTIRLGYFGSIAPQRYGLRYERVRGQDLDLRPPPGLYALSAHLVARSGGTLAAKYGEGPDNWMRHTRPAAIVGHAYYIYDLRPGGRQMKGGARPG